MHPVTCNQYFPLTTSLEIKHVSCHFMDIFKFSFRKKLTLCCLIDGTSCEISCIKIFIMQDTIVSVHVPLIRLMHPVYAAGRMPFATPWLDIFWQMARTVCCIDDVSRQIWLVLKTTVASWSYCHMKVILCTLLSCKSCLSYCCCWVSEKWLDVRFARAISGNLPVDAAVCFRCAIW